MLFALEGLDPSLELVKVFQEEQLPEHDALYQQKEQELKDAETQAEDGFEGEAESSDTGDDPAVADGETAESPDAEAGSGVDTADEEAQEIDGKVTTPATESIRNEVEYLVATEEYGEESTLKKAAVLTGSVAVGVSKFAWNVLRDTAGLLADLGVKYGPGIMQRIKSSVAMIAGRSLKLAIKLATVSVLAYNRKKHNFEKSLKRIEKLKKVATLLAEGNVELTAKEPFQNEKYFELFMMEKPAMSLDASVKRIMDLLEIMKTHIDRGMENDVRTIETLIDNTRRGVRFSPMTYFKAPSLTGKFMRKEVHGFSQNPDIVDTYVYVDVLPKNTLLLFGLPRDSVIDAATRSNDTADIVRAYHSSFIVIAANPNRPKADPMVNYVDIKTLVYLLERLETISRTALDRVSLYQDNAKRGERLKLGYRHYFGWLTANEEQKSLRDSLAELIYLKQTFATKVYLPAMLDIHDYVALYVTTMLSFIEDNLKVIGPVKDEASAV